MPSRQVAAPGQDDLALSRRLVGYQRLQWGRDVSAQGAWVMSLVPVLF